MSASAFHSALETIRSGGNLGADMSAAAFGEIMSGTISEDALADFLKTLAARNPTVDEITGAARAMRAAMRRIKAPPGAIDLCGTGGDGHGTLNVSTAVSFVVAASGVPVAKHGNRNMSSRTGAADVLEALGVKIDLQPEAAEACLSEAGVVFLFAQTYHPAMRHVAPVRKKLGIRTIFNLLGPLSNPAGVKRQLLGVYADAMIDPLAHVLAALGTEKAWVVHGEDGLDEMTTTAPTHVAVLDGGKVTTKTVSPDAIGVPHATLASLKGGDAPENAAALTALLSGAPGSYRDIVLLNAAAALVIAGKASDLKGGAALAADSIDSGRAKEKLAQLAECSHRARP
ncbi:MAG: anthranilate phosphoribosyltransferase [Alphaproteobacteria bacterium]|nr:anthranilate phosphoribosyltransferase [Alphaproteobacteria bacterium]